jgi:site-specific recombinase XerC
LRPPGFSDGAGRRWQRDFWREWRAYFAPGASFRSSGPTRADRLAALSGFYEVAVDQELIAHNPAARVRRPRLDDDSQRLGVDRQ